MGLPPKIRFSDRVQDYVRYRPSYPTALIQRIVGRVGPPDERVIADIGSGTGIFSRLLLEAGYRVHAVEPNAEMRAAAEAEVGADPRFRSVAAPAESTTLPAASVDLVTAAQAFHWFEADAFRHECRRILRPRAEVLLVWNERNEVDSEFLRAYEALLQTFGTDYAEVRHRQTEENGAIEAFFGAGAFETWTYPNEQLFDFSSLRGRLLSSSYAPPAGHPRHEPMLAVLREIFDRYAEGERVRFLYRTRAFVGRPRES